jgi:diaminopimelate epimerase
MKFTKMHGLGNDYVYVDLFHEQLPAPPDAVARAVSNRHFGIGSDGLILIAPSEIADARMRMFNADGSESEMCGNGIRCVAKFVHDHGIARKPVVTIETGRGVLTLDITPGPDGRASSVRVDMSPPILDPAAIPTLLEAHPAVDQIIELHGRPYAVTAVSMGNPHAVVFVPDVNAIDLPFLGPCLETHPLFPRRVNAHFVQVLSPGEVRMRTWERGSGPTLACGTGACAVCVAGVLTRRTERTILAHLPGGDLTLEWPDDHASVFMTGPATESFSGVWFPPPSFDTTPSA